MPCYLFLKIFFPIFFFTSGNELRPTVFHDYNQANVRISSNEVALKVLRLGYNNIHSLPTDCFEYLTNLEVLDLNNNPLFVIDQNTEISLGYLTNLQVNRYDLCFWFFCFSGYYHIKLMINSGFRWKNYLRNII